MRKLKELTRRCSALMAAAVMVAGVGSSLIPMVASADALNPLTDRSLTLSSSSPGWSYKDGSENATYAPPNSGANGQKTGNTYDFKVSTDTTGSPVKAMTFQYCTTPAGNCLAPGDDGWDGDAGSMTRNGDSATTSDLNVVVDSPTELSSLTGFVSSTSGNVTSVPNRNGTQGNYVVYYLSDDNDTPTDPTDDTWSISSNWKMYASNEETGAVADGKATGKMNYITLTNDSGQGFASGTRVKVVFFGTDDNYITNPGSDAFFVKINTYSDFTAPTLPNAPTVDADDVIDGGVTVANIMNQSIWIQTKVLETMDFSVGTVDPNTLKSDGTTTSELYLANGHKYHGICDRILTGMTPTPQGEPTNILRMGDENGEFSLKTDTTYSTHSYWRLSSNSSAGATVYYSGMTLSNTSGDQIDAIGATATDPLPGKEQFGLALDNTDGIDHSGTGGNNNTTYPVDYSVERSTGTPAKLFEWGADNTTNGVDPSVGTDVNGNASYHDPQLYPLTPEPNYGGGTGTINNDFDGSGSDPISTSFAFDSTSNTVPVPIASESTSVVDCVTGKMRYIANIAATTPAGIYTTKVNYIAAPQY